MVMFDFGAMPPEWNSARLTFGPGSMGLSAAAEAYGTVAEALNAAASGSDGSMSSMSGGWESPSSDSAQAAFRQHAAWLRREAADAAMMSELAASAVAAYEMARQMMPPLPVIMANLAAQAECVARGAVLTAVGGPAAPIGMATTAAELAVLEAEYAGMWATAATSMYGYAGQATGLAASMPTPMPAPTIGGPGGPSGSTFPGAPTTPGAGSEPNGAGPPAGTGGSQGPSGPGGQQPTPDPGGPTPDATQQVTDPTAPISEADRAASGVNDAVAGMNDSFVDPATSGNGDSPPQHGFYGTSPYSSTLAGMYGGTGGVAGLGMLRGGLGVMSGASTGFRMPANWNPGSGTAFGAGPGSGGGGMAPVGNTAPRRGVSAPATQMRRRRGDGDQEDKPGRIFAPGDPVDVPILERPPVIGVIEYEDEHTDDILADGDDVLLGVLDRFDEADTTEPATERFR